VREERVVTVFYERAKEYKSHQYLSCNIMSIRHE